MCSIAYEKSTQQLFNISYRQQPTLKLKLTVPNAKAFTWPKNGAGVTSRKIVKNGLMYVNLKLVFKYQLVPCVFNWRFGNQKIPRTEKLCRVINPLKTFHVIDEHSHFT